MSYKKYSDLVAAEQNQKRQENVVDLYSVHIRDSKHKEQLLQRNKYVIIDVYADWCRPCKVLAPKYAEMCKRLNKPGFLVMCKENVDLGLSLDVTALPTFLFYTDSQLVDKVVGADMDRFEQTLKRVCFSPQPQGYYDNPNTRYNNR